MKVVTLVENTTCRDDIGRVHGLSLYIETPEHRLLMDMGPNALFLENAEKLGVDISAVDAAVLSHGHYDHGGGLALFCKRNGRAKIYIHPLAFGQYFALEKDGNFHYIGIDPEVRKYADRFVLTGDEYRIDSELFLFSDVRSADYPTSANASLREKSGDEYPADKFLHEHDLIVSAEGKKILFAGCAHRGIVNIVRRAEEICGGELDYVFSGFHLTNPGMHQDEPRELIEAVGRELGRRRTKYVTGHCTGKGPYEILHEMLGDQVTAMHSGSVFEI
jgi:7,8-dihydropterin-6-yl-methyl-4-(beta-D-ribofuranosyl)aminobenzene 5'-phosphate synthase